MVEYGIVIIPLPADEGGGFAGIVPDLPGCMSDGESPEEALKNTEDAIAGWLEVNAELGRERPKVGAAVEQHRKRDAAVMEAFRTVLNVIDSQDGKIAGLERQIGHLLKMMQQEGSPVPRMTEITAVAMLTAPRTRH